MTLHEGQRLAWFSEEHIRKLTDKEIAYSFRGIVLDFYRERPLQRAINP